MARRSHHDSSNSSDPRSPDITAQFWGSSPSWNTTGSVRRVRRNGDRTGPVARTRKHGDRTGQIPVATAVPIEEPLIDPYDFGFDDVGYGPDPETARRRLDNWNRPSVDGRVDEPTEFVELIELEERRTHGPRDPVSTLAGRLGLGAVDPLLLRLGAIVMIGVLLVPVAMGLRPDSSKDSVRTEVAAALSTEPVALGAAPAVEGVPVQPVVGSAGDSVDLESTEAQASGQLAATPTTSPDPADVSGGQAEQTETVVNATSRADAADEPAGEPELDVAETVQAPPATAQAVSEAADADVPANRVAPVCHLSYTVAAGDYWIRIADAANTTLAKLLQANLATVGTPLYPGDDICLPEGATLPSPPTTSTAPPATTTAPTTIAPTTTTAPATTAPVVTAPPAPAAIEAIIREIFPDELEGRALEIAWRESGYRANAQNWCCYGLFQINWNAHRSWLDDIGVTSADTVARCPHQRPGGLGALPTLRRMGTLGRLSPTSPSTVAGLDSSGAALVAQRIEHLTTDQKVGSSNLSGRATQI